MVLARVDGTVTSTIKHKEYKGLKLFVCQPVDERFVEKGESFLAVDTVQAGVGDIVLVCREGNSMRQIFKKEILPIRSAVVAIVDEVSLTN